MLDFLQNWILTILIFLPIGGSVLLFCLPKNNKIVLRNAALFISSLTFILSIYLIIYFDANSSGMQFAINLPWLPASSGVRYILGIDGISYLLVLLTTFLSPLIILSTYSSVEKNVREFLALYLLLESAMLGTFISLDLVLFYIFWEAVLIPMYFMIGIWGGDNRIYATVKFFIFTFIGSVLMLVAFIYIYYAHAQAVGIFTTNIVELYKTTANLSFAEQGLLFLATTLAFAIKVPLFPFHTWLPDAHVQAPTAASVILAGVLLKMGTYGLIRFSIPMFPLAAIEYASIMIILGIIGIIYGALIAWRQTDIKKLVAYSSVSHLGFVVVGLFALNEQGITGAIYQMINHGITTSALFLLVGVIYERKHTREMEKFGGIAKIMPWYAVAFVIIVLGSAAVPGTGGFIGEWLILWGIFKVNSLAALFAGFGVVLGAVYLLWLVFKMFYGPITHEENRKLLDISIREKFILGIFCIFIFFFGLLPNKILLPTQKTVQTVVHSVNYRIPYKTELVTLKNAFLHTFLGDNK